MGPLDGTLGDVPISAAVPDAQGCSPSTGRCPIPVTAPLDLGVAERRWPPSFSPTELLWKTTGSCLMMLGAGSGIGCLLGMSLGVAVCCQSSGTRAFRGAAPRVRALGTCWEPSRPRHIRALGACGSGRCARWFCRPHPCSAKDGRHLACPPPVSGPSAPAGGGFCACLGRLRPFSPPRALSGPSAPEASRGTASLVNPGSPAGGGPPGRCGPLPG